MLIRLLISSFRTLSVLVNPQLLRISISVAKSRPRLLTPISHTKVFKNVCLIFQNIGFWRRERSQDFGGGGGGPYLRHCSFIY